MYVRSMGQILKTKVKLLGYFHYNARHMFNVKLEGNEATFSESNGDENAWKNLIT